MILTAIAFLSLAALLGMFLLSFVVTGKETPKAIVFTHGPLAAIGLVLLIIYVFKNSPGPIESVVLFTIAAIAGIVMVYKDLTGKKIPKVLAIAHGIIAIIGFVFLLIFAFR
jgi:glucan phosphoethanolaminetransferase (alkaline phosphatase superfamily)